MGGGGSPGCSDDRIKRKPEEGRVGGCSAPQTITPLSSLSSGASGLEVIIIHNVQNIYNDKTDTVGKAGPLTSQSGRRLQFLVHGGWRFGGFQLSTAAASVSAGMEFSASPYV